MRHKCDDHGQSDDQNNEGDLAACTQKAAFQNLGIGRHDKGMKEIEGVGGSFADTMPISLSKAFYDLAESPGTAKAR